MVDFGSCGEWLALKASSSSQALASSRLCQQSFHYADSLLPAVNQSSELMHMERYKEVTEEVLETIKKMIVSGPLPTPATGTTMKMGIRYV